MNVVIHHPKNIDAARDLREKIAVVHAAAIIRYIRKLTCPKKQKLELIDQIVKKSLP